MYHNSLPVFLALRKQSLELFTIWPTHDAVSMHLVVEPLTSVTTSISKIVSALSTLMSLNKFTLKRTKIDELFATFTVLKIILPVSRVLDISLPVQGSSIPVQSTIFELTLKLAALFRPQNTIAFKNTVSKLSLILNFAILIFLYTLSMWNKLGVHLPSVEHSIF